jgi:hypothetical protein
MAHDDSFDSRTALDADEAVLSEHFYRAEPSKPTHYKVICISMYTKDLERLDALVADLKSRGLTKANRSALIRAALEQVDLDRVPRGI